MEEEELQKKIRELREKRGSREEAAKTPDGTEEDPAACREEEAAPAFPGGQEEDPPAPARIPREEGFWGVLTVQSILALILAIAYVVLLTLSPTTAGEAVTLIQKKEQTDFSFRDRVYQTVTDVITYLNSIDIGGVSSAPSAPAEEETGSSPAPPSSAPSSSSSLPEENSSGAGGDFTPVNGWILPENCTTAPVVYTGCALFPIEGGGRITSSFGFREHPVQGKPEFHKAVDIAAAQGTNILAAFDGKVVESAYDEELGNYIILDHGNAFTTIYAHCDRRIAQTGMQVRQGEVIAKVGSTGDSTGFHLHFAMTLEGLYFDPAYIFPREIHAAV